MIRRAVPNGPRVATTVGLVVAAALAVVVVDDDDLIMVEVVEEVMDDEVAGGKRCFQPTSCIAEVVEFDPPTPNVAVVVVAAADDDVVAAVTFGLTRTLSFMVEFFDSNIVLLPIELTLSAVAEALVR